MRQDSSVAAPGGRERILAAAMATLEARGEAALRFADIAKDADVAVSVITHHFGTREGLIAELHARRFASISARDHEALQHLVERATTRAEFAAGVAAITAATFDDSRSEDRFARLVSIGAMHGRPELAAAIRQEATVMIDRVTQVIETGQSRGLVATDVDPRAVATFIRAYALGMVERYLDDRPTSREAVVEVILRAVGVFMTEPDSA